MDNLIAYIVDPTMGTISLGDKARDIRIIWEIHGGVQSIELEWAANDIDAYDFYRNHLGHQLFVADNYCDQPVADGVITGLSVNATGVFILANSYWMKHYDQLYNFDNTAQDTQQGSLDYVSATYETFEDTGQDFTEWASASSPALYEIEVINNDGTESIGFLGATAETTRIKVFTDYSLTNTGWLGNEPTTETVPESYNVIICYDYKTTTDIIKDAVNTEVPSINYDADDFEETNTVIGFWEPPIEEGGLYPGEVITKLASLSDSDYKQWNYYVQYDTFDGVEPSTPRACFESQVDDGSFDWEIKKWMVPSDASTMERNIQELRNAIRVIYRDMFEGDIIDIEPSIGYEEDDDSIADYWRREIILSGGDSTEALASQYAKLYLDKYKDSMFAKSISVTSPYILDDKGAICPLWFPIKYSKSWFRITDLFPISDILDHSQDRIHCSQAMMMEYSSSRNELRIRLDTEDDSIAALLARMEAFR